MDSDFVVTSGSRSSPPQTTSLSRYMPLQVHPWPPSWSFFCSAWVAAGSPPWLPSSAPPHTVEVSQIYHGTAFPHGSLAWAKVVTFSLLLVAAPTWEACPGSSSQKWGMQWVFLHFSCHFTILFYCFEQFFDAVSTVSTWRIISSTKRISILLHSQFGCLLFLPLAWVLWLGLQ